MPKPWLLSVAILLVLVFSASLSAEEGMWPIYDLDKLPWDQMKQRGLELDPLDVYNPDGISLTDAIVDISGGSSSFVSENGLIITNHHVAMGAIQKQSTLDQHYVRDGFYAPTLKDEIPAIGYTVSVLLSIEDKTEEVLSAVNDDMTDEERYDAVEAVSKKIIREAEEGRDVKCHLACMFEGKQYMLFTNFEIKDIRIVQAPPNDIGAYGGDIDNWMWPRHCGDFAFVRAYVAPDGSSADYSEDNVPYRPKAWFPISSEGVRDGDFTILLGFPGKTHRYTSAAYIDYLQNKYYPLYLQTAEDRIAILEGEAAKDSSIALRLMSEKSGINNFMKKTYGIQKGFKRIDAYHRKLEAERQLAEFINSNADAKEKYGGVLEEIDSLYAVKNSQYRMDHYRDYIVYACDYLSMANRIYRWAVEREKEDEDRQPGYQDRDTEKTTRRLRDAQINLVPSHDLLVLKYFVMKILQLPDDQRITAIDNFFGKDASEAMIEQKLEEMYAGTRIGDLDARMAMFGQSKEELEALDDPFINLAMALRPELDSAERRDEVFEGAMERLNPQLIQAYADWKGDELYPDANGTLRFNYGRVRGYSPADAIVYKPFTTLEGIMEKETGKDPFVVPEKLKEVYRRKDFGKYYDSTLGGVIVNFISDNSGTNGSSGSAVLNGKGELVGIDFDTGFEGVSADYIYNPDVCRAVIVDMRYVLFLIDHVYKQKELVAELTIH